jgi:hypothetical protein
MTETAGEGEDAAPVPAISGKIAKITDKMPLRRVLRRSMERSRAYHRHENGTTDSPGLRAIRSHFFSVIESTKRAGEGDEMASYLAPPMPSGRLAGPWL